MWAPVASQRRAAVRAMAWRMAGTSLAAGTSCPRALDPRAVRPFMGCGGRPRARLREHPPIELRGLGFTARKIGPVTVAGPTLVKGLPGGQAPPARGRGSSARSGLGPDDDLADDLAPLHRPLAVGGLLEREHSVHDRAQLAGEGESRDCQEIVVRPAVRALDRLLAAEEITDVRLADRPRGRA